MIKNVDNIIENYPEIYVYVYVYVPSLRPIVWRRRHQFLLVESETSKLTSVQLCAGAASPDISNTLLHIRIQPGNRTGGNKLRCSRSSLCLKEYLSTSDAGHGSLSSARFVRPLAAGEVSVRIDTYLSAGGLASLTPGRESPRGLCWESEVTPESLLSHRTQVISSSE